MLRTAKASTAKHRRRHNPKVNKQNEFDLVAYLGKRNIISMYLATTKGKKRQQANAYSSWKNALFNARLHEKKKDTTTHDGSARKG